MSPCPSVGSSFPCRVSRILYLSMVFDCASSTCASGSAGQGAVGSDGHCVLALEPPLMHAGREEADNKGSPFG